MLTPDYQEFANRGRIGYPWQYRDLWRSHGEKFTKSTERCGIATPQNRDESGTFRLCSAQARSFRPIFVDSTNR